MVLPTAELPQAPGMVLPTAELPRPGTSALDPVGAFLLRFDENGNWSIAVNGGPAITQPRGMLMTDPTVPSGGPVLTYLLPEPVITGTVAVLEPTGGISDALRFTNAAGDISGISSGADARMIFYSDFELGEILLDLADTGFPANLMAGNFVVGPTEVGPEGNNFFDWQPAGAYPANNEFIGVSDTTPVSEPASLALLSNGLAAMGLIIHRRRRQFRKSKSRSL